jgi:hypothetical protein
LSSIGFPGVKARGADQFMRSDADFDMCGENDAAENIQRKSNVRTHEEISGEEKAQRSSWARAVRQCRS